MSQIFKHPTFVGLAEFSSDGHLVIAILDKTFLSKSSVYVWNITEEKSIPQLSENKDYVDLKSYSHDGRWLVTINDDRSAQVWDAASRKPLFQPITHEIPLLSAQFSSNKPWIISILEDGTAQVWDLISGSSGNSENQASNLESVQLSPDGHRIIAIANNKSVQVWDAVKEIEVSKPFQFTNYVQKIKFSPDRRRLITLSIDQKAQVWDPVTGKPISEVMEHGLSSYNFYSPEFSADGRYVATSSKNSIKIWDGETGKLLSQPVKENENIIINKFQFSPDGHRLVTSSADSKICVWDINTGTLLLKPMEGTRFSFNQNGSLMLVVSYKTAFVVNVSSGKIVSKPMNYDDYVQFSYFSPDGRNLVTISQLGTAQIWTVSGTPVSNPIKHGKIKSVLFSPDKRTVLTISYDRSARVWNLYTGAPVSKLMQHKEDILISHFSADSRRLVTASKDKLVRVWDAITGIPISQPMLHSDQVLSVQLSSDNCCVVTASKDNKLRLWDAETGNPISVDLEHEYLIRSAYFIPKAAHIVTDSYISHIWSIPLFRTINNQLIEFIELISGHSINDKNILQEGNDVSRDDVRKWANKNSFSLLENEFINWWLSDPLERTITPYSTQTIAEQIQILIEHNTIDSLNKVLDYHPGHPMALAKLAELTLNESKKDYYDYIHPSISLWSKLALKYAPEDTAVREVAEKVLRDIAVPN